MARESSQDGGRPHAYRILFWILSSRAAELRHRSQIRLEGYVRGGRRPGSLNRIHPLRCNRAEPLDPQGTTDQIMVGDPIIFHALLAILSAAHYLELLVCTGVYCWSVGGRRLCTLRGN